MYFRDTFKSNIVLTSKDKSNTEKPFIFLNKHGKAKSKDPL